MMFALKPPFSSGISNLPCLMTLEGRIFEFKNAGAISCLFFFCWAAVGVHGGTFDHRPDWHLGVLAIEFVDDPIGYGSENRGQHPTLPLKTWGRIAWLNKTLGATAIFGLSHLKGGRIFTSRNKEIEWHWCILTQSGPQFFFAPWEWRHWYHIFPEE